MSGFFAMVQRLARVLFCDWFGIHVEPVTKLKTSCEFGCLRGICPRCGRTVRIEGEWHVSEYQNSAMRNKEAL